MILEFAVISLLLGWEKLSMSITKLSDLSAVYWKPFVWSETEIFWLPIFSSKPQSSQELLISCEQNQQPRKYINIHTEREREREKWIKKKKIICDTQWNSYNKENGDDNFSFSKTN